MLAGQARTRSPSREAWMTDRSAAWWR